MKNPFGIFRTGIKQAIQTTREIRESKKIEKQHLCKVIFIEKNNRVQEYLGRLSPNSNFLTIDILGRLFMVDQIYWHKQKSEMPVAFISTDYHRTISVSELSTINPDSKELIEDKHKVIFKTLNLHELDDSKSFNFTCDADTIMKSKAFEFLEEVSKRTIYFVLIIGLLMGLFLGSIMTAWVAFR